MPHSPPWTPSGGVEGQQLQQQGGSVSAEAESKRACCSVTGKCSWQVPICSWHCGPCPDAGCLHSKTRPCGLLYNRLPERTTILLQPSGLRKNCHLPANPCSLFSTKKPVSQRDSEVQTLFLNKLQITPGVYLIPCTFNQEEKGTQKSEEFIQWQRHRESEASASLDSTRLLLRRPVHML